MFWQFGIFPKFRGQGFLLLAFHLVRRHLAVKFNNFALYLCHTYLSLYSHLYSFTFMIYIKENYTLIRNLFAIITRFIKSAVLFSAKFAPIINETVSALSDVFFKSSIIQSVHFSISIIWINKQSIFYHNNPIISQRVAEFYILQFFSEQHGR